MQTQVNKNTCSEALIQAIKSANPVQVDTLWSILKYKEIGILRKVKCMSEVLRLNTPAIIEELPTDDEGRILDYKTRHMIHEVLIKIS